MTGRSQTREDIECPDCGALLPTRQGWQTHRRRKHGWVPTDKVCTRCDETKPVSAFGPISAGNTRPRSECRDCRRRSSTQTPAQVRAERKRYAGRKYGLTPDEYAHLVEFLTRAQGGRCAICEGEGPLVLDHCHTSGRFRSLLCRTCNAGLGMFRDRPDLLRIAATYLEV